MRFAILQLNPTVGDVPRNAAEIARLLRQNAQKADLFITPEQALIGYPPRDLLSQSWILDAEATALESLRALTAELGVGLLIGHCVRRTGPGKSLYNAASLFDSGQLLGCVHKHRLPGYDIFEDERFFAPAPGLSAPLKFRRAQLGISICEDGWDSVLAFGLRDVRVYPKNDAKQIWANADLLINLSASPYGLDKRPAREDLFCALATRLGKPLIYANATGGQDDLLFDGASFVCDAQGKIIHQAPSFSPELLFAEWSPNQVSGGTGAQDHQTLDELAKGLVTGLQDFVHKSGAQKVVLGLSGGIDSALCAALAAQALGPQNVLGVSLPSALTSDLSRHEARDVAQRLNIEFREIAIGPHIEQSRLLLGIEAKGLPFENLQSRTRALLLNTISNAEKRLLLSTGNKSELAMGYSTLYGDLCGALCPLGDLYKTEVYALSHHLNQRATARGVTEPISKVTLTRPPTAELAPDQKDTDSLPDYSVLDAILRELIENGGQTFFKEEGWDALLAPRFTVQGLRARYLGQEFKRRQAPPILKVHQRSFGYGWHVPVAKGLP
ncbi:MAG: NAD+ synthase [Bdellovibrionales bacterium]|nr:NAD+ synthase [Bdellovibrionales bacterium]